MKNSIAAVGCAALVACVPTVDPCSACEAIRDAGCPALLANPALIQDEAARAVAVEYCEAHSAH